MSYFVEHNVNYAMQDICSPRIKFSNVINMLNTETILNLLLNWSNFWDSLT